MSFLFLSAMLPIFVKCKKDGMRMLHAAWRLSYLEFHSEIIRHFERGIYITRCNRRIKNVVLVISPKADLSPESNNLKGKFQYQIVKRAG